MKTSLYILIGVLFVVLTVVLFKRHDRVPLVSSSATEEYATTTVTLEGEEFITQIADTRALQELGLSYRTSLAQNAAMIFVFPDSARHDFWMQGMNFPLDIIWLDGNKKVIYIEKNLSPTTYPSLFGPQSGSMYVIEVAAGTADRVGLKTGQIVSF